MNASETPKFHIIAKVSGETSKEAWSNLNAILCEAINHKQQSDHEWPQYVGTNDGSIEVVSDFQKLGRIAQLEARVKELKQDKAIADWIQENKPTINIGAVEAPQMFHVWNGTGEPRDDRSHFLGTTFREAIQAAMKGSR